MRKPMMMLCVAALGSVLFGVAEAANDQFFGQQWALEAGGQSFSRDLDDITTERVVVAANVDIGWMSIADRLPSLIQREPVVAVLDSGLDLEHPEIAANIFRNKSECTDKGTINPQANSDNDGNGFVGDCMGWNFVESAKGNARPYDTSGHGTHVAGIIAALTNNRSGIAGVVPRVKILPVRIVGNSENSESPARTEIFAKGIRYAADMGVDVINMSLGWPLSMQTAELRSAVAYALAKNITIVAAAGNNGHGNPTFPCSLPGVICVGALAPEGTLAEFSNFGGAVDMVAPGEFIYSLFPSSLRPVSSGVKGYEIKNGTSQAAPFVSAAAAILRGVYPGISNAEVHARLVASAKNFGNTNPTTPVMNGSLNLASAVFIEPRPVVEPVFKDLTQLPFSMDDLRFSFELPITNYWSSASDVRVAIRTASETLAFDESDFALGSLSKGDTSVLSVSGSISNPQAHCEVPIAVDIYVDGVRTGTYRTTLFFARELRGDASVTTMGLPSLSGFPLVDSVGRSLIKSVNDKFVSGGDPEYFVTSGGAPSGSIRFVLLRSNGEGEYGALPAFEIPGGQEVWNFVALDANRDGKRDYLVQTIVKSSTGIGMRFDWLDSDLRPLYGNKSVWNVAVEGAALRSNFAFLPANDPDIGAVSLPVFSEVGVTPKGDVYSDPFDTSSSGGQARHIYFINPKLKDGTVQAETRILDTNSVRRQIRETLGGGADQGADVSALLAQNLADFSGTRLQTLFLVGPSGDRKPYLVTFTGYNKFSLARIDVSGENISENSIAPLRNLNGRVADFALGTSLMTVFSPHQARMLTLHPKATLVGKVPLASSAEFDYRRGRRDMILSGLGAFENASNTFMFYQSKQKLLMQQVRGDNVLGEFELPIYRYSFLPGSVFNQMFYPVAYGDVTKRYAAFYTDNTSINRSSVQLIVASESGLSRPMNMSISMPSHCQALNPARMGESAEFSFVFLCNKELQFLPMSH